MTRQEVIEFARNFNRMRVAAEIYAKDNEQAIPCEYETVKDDDHDELRRRRTG